MKTKISLFALAVLLFFACSSKEEEPDAVRPVFYTEAGKDHKQPTRNYSGVTRAANEVKLSFKVGGSATLVAVEMGDTMNKGNVIARLDPADYSIAYNQAHASLKNAKAQLSAARSTYLRVENLYINNHVSLSEYEKAKTQYESAESMVETALSKVSAAKNKLDYTILRAPFDGIVSSVMIRENEMTAAGHPVVVYSSFNDLEVQTAVPENLIRQVSRGTKVDVRFSTLPGKVFGGIITEISPGTPMASAYPVIIQLTESTERLFPGMTATVEMPLDPEITEDIPVIVPVDAAGHDREGDFVYVAVPDNQDGVYIAEKRLVTLGELLADGYVVTQGINEGDLIITAGLSFLYDGRRVKLLDAKK